MTEQNDDGLDALSDELAILRSDWDWHFNPETGALACIIPKTAKSEDEWEQRALEMHSAQRTIVPSPKPRENALSRIARAD